MKNEHDIALELMDILNKQFCSDFHHSGTIFDADIIETRSFYDVIILVLYLKSKKDSIDFQNSIIECKNKNMREIKNYLIIFEEFKSYIQ